MRIILPVTFAALMLILASNPLRCLCAAQPEIKQYFRPDAPDMPSCILPDALTSTAGRKIATADDWKKVRRPEILELFRRYVYGRVPSTPYQENFTCVYEDAKAMDGKARRKQVDITVASGGKSLTIHLVLFVPNQVSKPVPTFLLNCNRGPENIDPTRKTRSDFWPAEVVVERGYAIAAFFIADVDPDANDGFHDGIHGLLDRGPRPTDAWGTIAA